MLLCHGHNVRKFRCRGQPPLSGVIGKDYEWSIIHQRAGERERKGVSSFFFFFLGFCSIPFLLRKKGCIPMEGRHGTCRSCLIVLCSPRYIVFPPFLPNNTVYTAFSGSRVHCFLYESYVSSALFLRLVSFPYVAVLQQSLRHELAAGCLLHTMQLISCTLCGHSCDP